MKKILVCVISTREVKPVIESWDRMSDKGAECTWLRLVDGDAPDAHRFDNMLVKLKQARRVFLEGDYDAMLCFDDDQIIPANAIQRLMALDCDVAYGLTVWRHWPYRWSAALSLGEDTITTVDQAQITAQAWGEIISVAGVGLFCTLIKRHVLEAIDFELRGDHGPDRYFALDCQARGFPQKADCGLIVGHWSEQGVYWPAPWGYTVQELHSNANH